MTETPLTKAQTAAQELLNRTHVATKRFVDTLTESTDRLSSELSANARGAMGTVQETRQRVRTEVKAKAEPTTEQITDAVNELISWARRNSERLVADIDEFRAGLETRLAPVTVVTKADLAELEARLAETEATLAKAVKAQKAATKAKAPAKKAAAKAKAPAKKAATKG